MASLDPNKQYISDDIRGLGLNSGDLWSGNTISYGGSRYKVRDNGNGTRGFELLGGGSGSSGSSSVTDLLSKQTADRAAFDAKNKAAEDAYLARYTGAINGQEKVGDMATRIGGDLGLPGLRSSAQSLTKTLSEIPQVQKSATRGFDVNQNQQSRIISSEQGKIAPLAQTAMTQQQAAEQELSTRLGYGVAQQAKDLQPLQLEGSLMSDRIARETTGYSQDRQNELQVLLQKIQSDAVLSAAEYTRATELMKQENDFANQMKLQESKNNQPISVSEGNTLFDPRTGRPIYTAPKTYAPTGGAPTPTLGLKPNGQSTTPKPALQSFVK